MSHISHRKKEEVEAALVHLMYQFRQIDQKYGLMVTEEITSLFQERNNCITDSQEKMDYLNHIV